MKKLTLQFVVFAAFLLGTLGYGYFYTEKRLIAEERIQWEREAERVYDILQAQISERMVREDARSFLEYRYYYVPEGQVSQKKNISISPLAELPNSADAGLIGYFQVDPDGSFHSPYLPTPKINLIDGKKRQELHDKLKKITLSLQKGARDDYASRLAEEKKTNTVPDKNDKEGDKIVELGKSKGSVTGGMINTADKNGNNDGVDELYPNPLKKRESEDKKFSGMTKKKADKSGYTPRKIKNDPAQSQAFEEQNAAVSDLSVSANKVPAPTMGKDESKSDPAKVQEEDLSSIFIDPFRARLVGDAQIVFYRKVWLGQKLYLQGFVVELAPFFRSHSVFDDSALNGFARAGLFLDDRVLLSLANHVTADAMQKLFSRNLGYPLSLFEYRVESGRFPPSAAHQLLVYVLFGVVFMLLASLFFIYRGVRAEVLLSRKRQDFVSAVTHELKTPLTSIRMYAEMLEQDWVKDEKKRHEYYESLSREGERLSRLIENILHLSSLEKGTFRVNSVHASPTNDFKRLVRDIEQLAVRAGFSCAASVAENIAAITYDVEILKQVFLSLLDNSIKFSQDAKNKVIDIKLAQQGNQVLMSLADRGPGVVSNELTRIFDTFYRVESEMTRKTKGSGIGLAMVRMMAEAMGAKVRAVNRIGGGLEIILIWHIDET